MIVIYYEPQHLDAAHRIQEALKDTYQDQLHVELVVMASGNTWPGEPSWDDLMIVPFGQEPCFDLAHELLRSKLGTGPQSCPILPVALSDTRLAPPEPIGHLKALLLSTSESEERLTRRVGALLGLRLRSRDQSIFISYRSIDGTVPAEQIEKFLTENGYRVWRDEARDAFDGETSIEAAKDVQSVIEQKLGEADLLLILDTPQAPSSRWIKLEIDLANGRLIPVLPLLFFTPEERRRRKPCRFRSLASLQRGCVLRAEADGGVPLLTKDELTQVLEEIEIYLTDIFRRKLRVPFLVQKEFLSKSFEWSKRDRFIYEALRQQGGALRTRVFSHCSYFEGIYNPSLLALIEHFDITKPRANYALYVYDGQILSPLEIEEIRSEVALADSTDVIILHNQEIAGMLKNNFNG